MPSSVQTLIRRLLDASSLSQERVDAAGKLGLIDDLAGRDALLIVASDEQAPSEVLTSVGAALANIYARADTLQDAPLVDFAGAAYVGFDDRATQLLGSAE